MHQVFYVVFTLWGLSLLKSEVEEKDYDGEEHKSKKRATVDNAAYGPATARKAMGQLTGPSYGDFVSPVPYLRDDGMDLRSDDRVGGFRSGRNELSLNWGKPRLNQESMYQPNIF